MSVKIAATLAEIKTLSIEERLALVEAIWDSIATEPENLPLTYAQPVELERRLAHTEPTPTMLSPGMKYGLRHWRERPVDRAYHSSAGRSDNA
jgi:putative addiction module component (TIGR02574 family)